jgi:cytochrome c biogenesis protein CcmG, thiol:disulfide interchange protein DsbE
VVRLRVALPLLALALGLVLWKLELFVVRPGAHPSPLVLRPVESRTPVALDVALPAVPEGIRRLTSDDGPLVLQYWAPWQLHARAQVRSLDSLRREPDLEGLRIVVVCFDPFPSVTRYVTRQRLRLPVLLDGPGELRRTLPCPSLPFTYVIDGQGRIAAAQPGEIDWWSSESRAALRRLVGEPAAVPAPPRHI